MRNVAKKPFIAAMMALGLLAMMQFTALAAQADGVPTIIVSNAEGNVGDIVDVNISLANNPGIITMLVEVSFDDSAISLVGLEDKDVLGYANHSPRQEDWVSPFTLYWDSLYNLTTNGDVITLKFRINSAEGSTVSIGYTPGNIYDIDFTSIDFAVVNGFVGPPQLIKEYTVTFNADNGSLSVDVPVVEGEKVTKPADPVKEGNIFLGWFIGIGNEKFDFDSPITANITLTAKWELEVVLTDVKVTTLPGKTVYTVGDALNLSGMVVTAYYSDETTEIVTTLVDANPANGAILSSTGPVPVTVSYGGLSDGFTVTVEPKPRILTDVKVTTLPGKTVYTVGDALDLSGMVVTAYYSDITTEIVTTLADANPANGAILSSTGPVPVTVSYGGFSDGFTVTVNEKPAPTLESIAVTTQPSKTTYTAGDALDLSGMVVTATYSDESAKAVIGYTTEPAAGATLDVVGPQTVTVSYTEGEATQTTSFTVTVNEKPAPTLESIAVTTQPNKVVYTAGEALDLSGMVVTATYSDESAKAVIGYTTEPVAGATLDVVGPQTVTVSYTEDEATQTTSFAVTVNEKPAPTLESIAVTTQPNKVVYTAGEALDLSGMVVTATYSDESAKAVIGYTTEPAAGATLNVVGEQTVTVSYTEGEATQTTSFTVTVNDDQQVPEPELIGIQGLSLEMKDSAAFFTEADVFDITNDGEGNYAVTLYGNAGAMTLYGVEYAINAPDGSAISLVLDSADGFEIPLTVYAIDGENGVYFNDTPVTFESGDAFVYKVYVDDVLSGTFTVTYEELTNIEIVYEAVTVTRVGLTNYDYEVKASIQNSGDYTEEIKAFLVGYPSNSTVIKGDLTFGDFSTPGILASDDNFIVRIDRTGVFDESKLVFIFTANPGK